MSINVEYNAKEVNQIIMENVLKMLEMRKLIKSWSDEYKKLSNVISTKSVFEIELADKTNYSIYIVDAYLSSIVQGTPLDDYLSNNLDIHKIVIAKDVAKKVVKQIVAENAEFFFVTELMENICDKTFMPQFFLLEKEEKEELLTKFSKNELSPMFLTDRMARHYNAKTGDIFKIIRPSFTAGKNVFYRRVVNGSWDAIF
jgi:DNA-directed RNA polymerase subunit H (RpoH/RPB5)